MLGNKHPEVGMAMAQPGLEDRLQGHLCGDSWLGWASSG